MADSFSPYIGDPDVILALYDDAAPTEVAGPSLLLSHVICIQCPGTGVLIATHCYTPHTTTATTTTGAASSLQHDHYLNCKFQPQARQQPTLCAVHSTARSTVRRSRAAHCSSYCQHSGSLPHDHHIIGLIRSYATRSPARHSSVFTT